MSTTKTNSERISKFGEKIGGSRADLATSGGTSPRRKQDSDDTRPAWQRRYRVARIDASRTESEVGRYHIIDTRKVSRYRPNGEIVGGKTFATEAEAEQAIPLYEVARNHRVQSASDSTTDAPRFEVVRIVSERKRPIIKGGFSSRDDAHRWLVENAVAIIETKTRIDASIHPAIESVERSAALPSHRPDAEQATPRGFLDAFEIRGGEMGNWVNSAEGRELLNYAFDSLHDLGGVIGAQPSTIGLGNDLAIAFGARGHGLHGARAHYESDYCAINLTKLKGAGALAHEWWHAFDHFLARLAGMATSERKENTRGDSVYPSSAFVSDGHGRIVSPDYPDAVRAAVDNLMSVIQWREIEADADYTTADKFNARRVEHFRERLQAFRDGLAKDYSGERWKPYRGKKRNEAMPADKLAAVDAIIAHILEDGAGERSEYRSPNKNCRNHPTLGARLQSLELLYFEHRGRNSYRMSGSGYSAYLTGGTVELQSLATVAQNSAAELDAQNDRPDVVTKRIRTNYYNEAKKMDLGARGDYWSTAKELAAHAFGAFVEDELTRAGGQNTFLAHAQNNRHPAYILLGLKPFPEGGERAAINQAFRNLFEACRAAGVYPPAGFLCPADGVGVVGVSEDDDSAAESLPLVAEGCEQSQDGDTTGEPTTADRIARKVRDRIGAVMARKAHGAGNVVSLSEMVERLNADNSPPGGWSPADGVGVASEPERDDSAADVLPLVAEQASEPAEADTTSEPAAEVVAVDSPAMNSSAERSLTFAFPSSPTAERFGCSDGCYVVRYGGNEWPYLPHDSAIALHVFESGDAPIAPDSFFGPLDTEPASERRARMLKTGTTTAEAPATPAQDASPPRGVFGATMALNDDKGGVEITFASKPDSATRDRLKAQRFRWSRRNGLWYARQTPERIAFARSLCGPADGGGVASVSDDGDSAADVLPLVAKGCEQSQDGRRYNLHYVKRDAAGREVSREKIGGDTWEPMSHAEACTVKSKFSQPEGYTIELAEIVSDAGDPATPAPDVQPVEPPAPAECPPVAENSADDAGEPWDGWSSPNPALSEVEQLRQQIAELESQVETLTDDRDIAAEELTTRTNQRDALKKSAEEFAAYLKDFCDTLKQSGDTITGDDLQNLIDGDSYLIDSKPCAENQLADLLQFCEFQGERPTVDAIRAALAEQPLAVSMLQMT